MFPQLTFFFFRFFEEIVVLIWGWNVYIGNRHEPFLLFNAFLKRYIFYCLVNFLLFTLFDIFIIETNYILCTAINKNYILIMFWLSNKRNTVGVVKHYALNWITTNLRHLYLIEAIIIKHTPVYRMQCYSIGSEMWIFFNPAATMCILWVR